MIPAHLLGHVPAVRAAITAVVLSAVAATLASCADAPRTAGKSPQTQVPSGLSVKAEKPASGRPWLGMRVEDLLDEPRGPAVTRIVPGGPADRAGLKVLDVIVKFDGDRVLDADSLANRVRESVPGQVVLLEIYRNGKRLRVALRVAENRGTRGRP